MAANLPFRLLASALLASYGTALRLPARADVPSARGAAAPQLDRRTVLVGAGSAAALAVAPPVRAAEPLVYKPAQGSMDGSTVLITGANTGLGLESAKRLAAAGATIIATARSQAKADGAAKDVAAAAPDAKVFGIELDLADLASVKSFPQRLRTAVGSDASIDVLLNNAGVMAIPERLETSDGFERTVGVNHLGHYALVATLLPFLKKAANGFRIVNVSSDAHRFASADSIKEALQSKLDPSYTAWGNYAISKAANVLFTVELEQKIKDAGLRGSAVALHPGVVQTDLSRYIVGGVAAADTRLSETAPPPTGVGKFLKESVLDKLVIPVALGANTQVFLASAGDTGGDRTKVGGLYYDDHMKAVKPNGPSADPTLASQLWKLSEELTGFKIEF